MGTRSERSSTLRVLTWNTAHRKAQIGEQLLAIQGCEPDIVALQEVIEGTLAGLSSGLAEIGLDHVCDSFQLSSSRAELTGPRRYGQLIASRYPIELIPPSEFDIPWPERVLSCWFAHPDARIEFHTTHIPPGSTNKWIKIETFEGIYSRLACEVNYLRLLCGDFNSPDAEFPDGRVKVFGERVREDGEIVPERHRNHPPGRWSRGERSVILGLAEFGLPDVFRSLHGYEVKEASWWHHWRKTITKRRFDHVFASPALNSVKADYVHHVREDKISDHSALLVEFSLLSGSAPRSP